MFKKIVIVLMVINIVISCSTLNNIRLGKKQDDISMTSWVLEDSNSNRPITLEFKNNKITGYAGCNNYFSNQIELNSETGRIQLKSIGSTRMTCPDIKQENNFLSLLDKASFYVIKENVLELYADKILILRFKRK